MFVCHKIIYLVFTSFISLLMSHCCLLKHTPFNLSVKKLQHPAIICIVYAVQVQMHTGDYSNYTCTGMEASTCVRVHARTHTQLPLKKYSWNSILLETESIPGPQCSQKNYVNEKFQTPLGNEPVTFRLVAQCLNQLRHCMPSTTNV